VHASAKSVDLRSGFIGTEQQFLRAGGVLRDRSSSFLRMTAPLLVHVFAQQLAILRIEQAHLPGIPLHL